MKTNEAFVFDEHQVALDLGYSEEEIEYFNNLHYVLTFWSDELEEGRCKSSDFPVIDRKKLEAFRKYAHKISGKQLKLYIDDTKYLFP